MKFTLPTLPYDYAALEPFIDTRTMELHHTNQITITPGMNEESANPKNQGHINNQGTKTKTRSISTLRASFPHFIQALSFARQRLYVIPAKAGTHST
jgi:superoxide dismutase